MFYSPAQQANRRKLVVFGISFLLLAVAGLVYSYSRPAIYRSQARVQINPGALQVEAAVSTGGTQGANASRSLMSELQVLTSRPLVQAVFDKLPAEQKQIATGLGQDPVAVLQTGLQADVAQGTDMVEIASLGANAGLAAAVVNGLIADYTQQLNQSYAQSATSSLAQINDEVAQLTLKVQGKRRQMEDFRIRHNIVSLEREENDILGRVKGQTEALNKAQEKLALTEGKLRAMTDSASAGRPTAAPLRANATLDNLEQRASAGREELSELNRAYTPEYLAMDPRARAVRNRLAELDRQIATQRQSSGQTVQTDQSAGLADAREEVSAARDTVARLAQQASGNRGTLQQFASRFNEFKTMREELSPLESLLRDATQRKARQEAGEAARRPSVRLVEPAFAPRDPWSPQYTRDAAIVLGAALLLALLTVGVIEFFNRTDAAPTMVLAQAHSPAPNYANPYGIATGYDALALGNQVNGTPRLPRHSPSQIPLAVEHTPGMPLLPTQLAPRELLQEEIAALLANATPQAALFAHLLLRGVSAAEAVALQPNDVNIDARSVHLAGVSARDLPLDDVLEGLVLTHLAALGEGACLLQSAGQVSGAIAGSGVGPSASARLDQLITELLYAAHDAGIDQPTEITPDALRHTYAAFLARQGIRLADLARAMGALKPEQAALYSGFAPPGQRLSLEQVDRLVAGVMASGRVLHGQSVA